MRSGFVLLFTVLAWGISASAFSAPESAAQVRILAFGDSLTAGYGLKGEHGFTAQLQRKLDDAGYSSTVVNGGASGDTTTGGLARLDWMLAEPFDAVIVALGANDALRAVSTDLVRSNLEQILETLNRRGLAVLLCGFMAPRNLGAEYVDAFDAIYPQLAERFDIALYPHFLEGVATDLELNQPDGIHPNQAGVAVIVENMTPYVIELIRDVSRQRAKSGG